MVFFSCQRFQYRNIDADIARAEAAYQLQMSQYYTDLYNDKKTRDRYPALAQYYKTMVSAQTSISSPFIPVFFFFFCEDSLVLCFDVFA